MTTDPGDLVLDPTCGSGTTAYVAEQWGRRWITIDTSRVALALARQRLMGARYPVLPARRLRRGPREGGELSATAAATGDVARRHPPRLRVRASAAHHAEVDRQQPRHHGGHDPGGDRRGDQAARRVRAALRQAVRGQEEGARRRAVHGREPVAAPVARVRRQRRRRRPRPSTDMVGRPRRRRRAFEQTILANLRRPASRTAARSERLELDSGRAYAGAYIQAVGDARGS